MAAYEFDPTASNPSDAPTVLAGHIKAHAEVAMPDGTKINKTGESYEVQNRAKRTILVTATKDDPDAAHTAQHVLNMSALSHHPDSMGGRKAFPSYKAYLNAKNRAK
jgi:hypothetical protein